MSLLGFVGVTLLGPSCSWPSIALAVSAKPLGLVLGLSSGEGFSSINVNVVNNVVVWLDMAIAIGG